MTFSFMLYAIPLLVAWIIYFRVGLGDLAGGKLSKDSEVCHCQH